MVYKMEIAMNTLKTACVIGIVLISVCFQGCCLSNNKEAKMTRELGVKAYSYIEPAQLDELLKDLVQKAITGGDYDIDKYIYVHKLIHNATNGELIGDYDVELLKGLGDARFMKALKRQNRELQWNLCGSLLRFYWNVDGWKEQYDAAKARPEYQYPKTKKYVFELSKSWYKD